MRKAQKKDINTSGITKRLLNKLDKLSGGDIEIKKAIVDKAIESSWLSFYPLNDADIATVKNKNNDVNEPKIKIKPVYENMLENDF